MQDITVTVADGYLAIVPKRASRWDVVQRIAVYAALLAFCVLCWWGFITLMFRLFGG